MQSEVEKFFNCPYCFEEISMLLDSSVEEAQEYVEDCQVCCQPIQIRFQFESGDLISFDSERAQD
jgi:hypothetical protein